MANVGGSIDLSTAEGRRRFYEAALAAQFESELKSERLKLKHAELAAAGHWQGGQRPFGYALVPFQEGNRIKYRLELDPTEAAAINRWSGNRVKEVRVSSTKSSVGHLLGAAGAVEAAICLMALRGQFLPPTSTLQHADPACAFEIVRQPADAKLEYAMTNSFGFGGANASLIFRGWS